MAGSGSRPVGVSAPKLSRLKYWGSSVSGTSSHHSRRLELQAQPRRHHKDPGQ